MPQHTVGLLEATVIFNANDTAVHPSNFGPGKTDLLEEIAEYIDHVGRSGGVTLKERFFTKVSATKRPQRRDLRIELDYGRYGSPRRVRESSTGQQTGAVKTTEVAGDGLRLVAAVPTVGKFAIIAHEVIGLTSVAGLFIRDFSTWFSIRNRGFRIEMAYLEDSDAWTEFLAGAQLKELTFIAHRPAQNNRAGLPTQEIYDVRPDKRGGVLPRRWLDALVSNGHLPPSQVLSVPVNANDIDETRIVVKKDKRKRSISIGSMWPRFTWEIVPDSNKRPGDVVFYKFVDELIVTRYFNRGIVI